MIDERYLWSLGVPCATAVFMPLLAAYNDAQKERSVMAGKFEIYEDKAGKFRFHLKAGNGEVVAVGRPTRRKLGPLKELTQYNVRLLTQQ